MHLKMQRQLAPPQASAPYAPAIQRSVPAPAIQRSVPAPYVPAPISLRLQEGSQQRMVPLPVESIPTVPELPEQLGQGASMRKPRAAAFGEATTDALIEEFRRSGAAPRPNMFTQQSTTLPPPTTTASLADQFLREEETAQPDRDRYTLQAVATNEAGRSVISSTLMDAVDADYDFSYMYDEYKANPSKWASRRMDDAEDVLNMKLDAVREMLATDSDASALVRGAYKHIRDTRKFVSYVSLLINNYLDSGVFSPQTIASLKKCISIYLMLSPLDEYTFDFIELLYDNNYDDLTNDIVDIINQIKQDYRLTKDYSDLIAALQGDATLEEVWNQEEEDDSMDAQYKSFKYVVPILEKLKLEPDNKKEQRDLSYTLRGLRTIYVPDYIDVRALAEQMPPELAQELQRKRVVTTHPAGKTTRAARL